MNISELIKYINKDSIVIANKDVKKYIFDYYKNELVPFKMMDYKSFYDYGVYDVTSDVLVKLMNLGNSYDKANLLIRNYYLYHFFELDEGLYSKEELDVLNSSIINYEYIQKKYLESDLIFINPDKTLDTYQIAKAIYKNIKEYNLDINNLEEIYITKCNSISDEVENLLSSINDFNKDIFILAPSDYNSYIYKYSKIYNINISIKDNNSLFSYNLIKGIVKDLSDDVTLTSIKRIDNVINEYISNLKDLSDDELDLVDKFVGVVNETLDLEIKDSVLFFEVLIEKLKETPYNKKNNSNIVVYNSITDNLLIKGFNKELYILGAIEGVFPSYYKDNSYIKDSILDKYNLYNSLIKNEYLHDYIIYELTRFNKLNISYNTLNHKELSSIFKDLYNIYNNIKFKEVEYKINNKYSYKLDKIIYGRLMDDNIKYKVLNPYISSINTNSITEDYLSYDHKFNGTFKIETPIKLSYTNLDVFNKCKYYYYLKYILKITDRKNRYRIYFGDFFHEMLQKLLDNKISLTELDSESDKFIEEHFKSESDYEIVSYYYHHQLKELLENAYYYITEYQNKSKLDDKLFEKEFEIKLDNNYKDTLYGKLDKIMSYKDNDGKINTVVVDYKTGNIGLLKKDHLENGLSLQLPFYIYLLTEKDPNNYIIGAFLQKIIPNESIFNIDEFSINEIYMNTLRYTGILRGEYSTDIIDEDKYIYKPVRNKEKYEYILTDAEQEKLKNIVYSSSINALNDIHEGNFNINPKELNGEEVSCKYCPYKGICNKDYKDLVILESTDGEEDE